MVMSENRRWTTVRIKVEVIPPLEEMIKNARDEFGMPLFKNKSDAVTKALKDFLKKHQATRQGSSTRQGVTKALKKFFKKYSKKEECH